MRHRILPRSSQRLDECGHPGIMEPLSLHAYSYGARRMNMLARKIAIFAAALAIALPLLAGTDPFIGTWVLNKEKSRFDPGPMPQNITHTYQPWGKDGMK